MERKPPWLRIKLPSGARYEAVHEIVRSHKLNTVCAESKCPNIAECWGRGTATLMLMGSVCTRACRFCSVSTGNPQGWLDPMEPLQVADAVALMGLKYVVLTSVDRDDLPDGGAAHYAACVRAIHQRSPQTAVEALTPDFAGNHDAVAHVLDAGLTTYAQNLETVERLTHPVRDPRAGYAQTLDVLAFAKRHAPQTLTKTSLMLGLGETDARSNARWTIYAVPTSTWLPWVSTCVPARIISRCSASSPRTSFASTASWRWARASWKRSPDRWCVRVIAPNACWSTTTWGCNPRATGQPLFRMSDDIRRNPMYVSLPQHVPRHALVSPAPVATAPVPDDAAAVRAREQRIDAELAQSFPASDPPSWVHGTVSAQD
ncbi:lipoyl synthase [Rhodanobacter sp. 115]|uniref:lipoyl synthase n=2 Tax=Rhodanobacter sp. FW021-MT20 TaxID=1162282 RepID=UPI001ED94835|nr:lipoyl synthase [Rhodanobacter sp. 115]